MEAGMVGRTGLERQKEHEATYKAGDLISEKGWDEDGNPK